MLAACSLAVLSALSSALAPAAAEPAAPASPLTAAAEMGMAIGGGPAPESRSARSGAAASPAQLRQAAGRSGRRAAPVRTTHAQATRPAVQTKQARVPSGAAGGSLVAEARRHIGTNPTSRRSLWCGRFMNMVLENTGRAGTGSDMARSFASYGKRVSGPQVGAIAVMSRGKRGGHVGVVSGVDERGNPILISGNHGRRVAEAAYPRSRVLAYVIPTEG